jgi:hypothetical protein
MVIAPIDERNADTSASKVVYELQPSEAPSNNDDVMIGHNLPFW